MLCLRNLWRTLTHEHAAHCWTVWSAHGAAYCWVCERAVTATPVSGYAIVGREDGQIQPGNRGGVPTGAFFLSLPEAVSTLARLSLDDRCVIRPATATGAGITIGNWVGIHQPSEAT